MSAGDFSPAQPQFNMEELVMNQKGVAIAAASALALAFAMGVAVGQNSPPTENKGVSVGAPTSLDLTDEIDSVAGRQLRMRVVTIEPGGVVAIHSHKGRPAVAYALQGTLVEHLENGDVREHPQGEAWTEDRNTTHWAENKGDEPVKVIAVDVFKP
jgi:quercetin dioxygenase-like cupin family protein